MVLNSDDTFQKHLISLNQEQRNILYSIMDHIETELNPLHLFLEGPGGNGKSHLAEATAQWTERFWNRLERNTAELKSRILKIAPTGTAASHINGTTIHSAFGLRRTQQDDNNNSMLIQRKRIYHRSYDYLTEIKLIIIDEISSVHPKDLKEVDIRLRMRQNPNLPFGGRHVIVVGDFFQLGPVGGHLCSPQQQFFDLWKIFHIIILTVNVRHQSDPEFARAILEFRTCEFTPEGLSLVQACVITEQQFKDLLKLNHLEKKLLILHDTNDAVAWTHDRQIENNSQRNEITV